MPRTDPAPDHAADILSGLCARRLAASPDRPLAINSTPEASTWILKANVTVLRHADRTPKQKLKFNFPIDEPWTQPFVRLLNDETEEIILRERDQLVHIATAIEEAKSLGAIGDDLNKLTQLNKALASKIEYPGTKAQLKPVYSKKQPGSKVRYLTKLTLVFKWGGEVRPSIPPISDSAVTLTPIISLPTRLDTSRGTSEKTSARISRL